MRQIIRQFRNALMPIVPFFRNLSAPIKPMPNPPPIGPGVLPTPPPSPVDPTQTPAPLNLLAIAYAHLVGKDVGKFINVSRNPYGAQCVEIVQDWCDILGIERFPGNAADFEFDAHPDCIWTPNTPTNVPPVGSIVVWGKSPTLPFGHVSVSGVADTLKFTGFGQNWPLGSAAHQQAHTYGGVRGWLTPILSHVKYRPPVDPGAVAAGAAAGVAAVLEDLDITPAVARTLVELAYRSAIGRNPNAAELASWSNAALADPANIDVKVINPILTGGESITHKTLIDRLKEWWAASHAGPAY